MDAATLRKDGCADLLPPSRLAPRPKNPAPTLVVLSPTHRGAPPFSARLDALAGLAALEQVAERHGLVPTYALDHALSADGRQLEPLLALHQRGRAHLGAHLVPALTPPLDGTPPALQPGNLRRELEREKLEVLKERIGLRSGERPRVYVAACGGIGKSSPALLAEAGMCVDASPLVGFDLSPAGGPNFAEFPAAPFFYPAVPNLLGLPQSGARLSWFHGRVDGLVPVGRALGMERAVPLDVGALELGALVRVLSVLAERGVGVFTLVARVEDFHGPRGADVAARFDQLLRHVTGPMGGRLTTHMGLWDEIGHMPEVDGPYAKSRRARS